MPSETSAKASREERWGMGDSQGKDVK